VPSKFEFTNSLGQNFSLPFVKIKFELKQGIAHCDAHLLFLSLHWAADSFINVTGPGSVGQPGGPGPGTLDASEGTQPVGPPDHSSAAHQCNPRYRCVRPRVAACARVWQLESARSVMVIVTVTDDGARRRAAAGSACVRA
jgi:hypothetical protein